MRLLQEFSKRKTNNRTRYLLIGIDAYGFLYPMCWSYNKDSAINHMQNHAMPSNSSIVNVGTLSNSLLIIRTIQLEIGADIQSVRNSLDNYIILCSGYTYSANHVLLNYNTDKECKYILDDYIVNYVFSKDKYLE